MTHYLIFPDKSTWEAACEAAEWVCDGRYAYADGVFVSVVGQRFRKVANGEDAVFEKLEGYLVNIYQGLVPSNMQEYVLAEAPQYPKEVLC